ncbi:unnamed protein product, partial [Didymodactylos carnosus]
MELWCPSTRNTSPDLYKRIGQQRSSLILSASLPLTTPLWISFDRELQGLQNDTYNIEKKWGLGVLTLEILVGRDLIIKKKLFLLLGSRQGRCRDLKSTEKLGKCRAL